MMEDIIKLIIHEAETRQGVRIDSSLKDVLTEIYLIIQTMASDLSAIRRLEIDEPRKAEMRALILTSYKA